jgi:glycerol-3-phosphate acyltransferase PlsY
VLVLATAVVILLSYLLGSIPTGYLVARAKGIDIRKVGSGNIGATNAFRILGKKAGVLVLLADAFKGAAAVVLAPLVAGMVLHPVPSWIPLVAGVWAILGHNFTCWLGFKGGKGIATSAGVLGALVPLALGIALAVWLLVFALSRYVSLASIAAAAALPVATVCLDRSNLPNIVVTSLIGALAIWRHRPNISRLLAGTESRFGKKPTTPAP